MTEENSTITNDNSGTVTTSTNDDISFDSIAEVEVSELNDNQKQFILDNAGELTDEQRETYKDVLEGGDGEGEDENADPEKVEIKTRTEPEEEDHKGKDNEESDEVDPDDKKAIGQVVDEKLGDFRKSQTDVQILKDKQEVNDFIADNPDFKKYRDVMLKYLSHPAYKNIPVDNIAKIVAGNDLQKIGAKKEREAANKAKSTQDTGNTVRQQESKESDWLTASQDAFNKKKNEVLGIK